MSETEKAPADETPDMRVRVELRKDGELMEAIEGRAIIGTVVADGCHKALCGGALGKMDLVKAAESLVDIYLDAASKMGLLPIAKLMLLGELSSWEEGDGDRD